VIAADRDAIILLTSKYITCSTSDSVEVDDDTNSNLCLVSFDEVFNDSNRLLVLVLLVIVVPVVAENVI
jgi:hypothetical protein